MNELERLFNQPRVTARRSGAPDTNGQCVVYWMQRAQRGIDNPALNVAIEAANLLGKPVVVFLGILPNYPHANLRHYSFLAQGVPDLAAELNKRGVGFVFRPYPQHHLIRFCEEVKPALVVGDENPLREPEGWRVTASKLLGIPLWTVEADVIVPSKLFGRQHYSARTIRPHIHAALDEFLQPLSNPLPRVTWRMPRDMRTSGPDSDFLAAFPIDRSTGPVSAWRGGSKEGMRLLYRFVKHRLKGYDSLRNHPELEATSQLSPYLHFGHLGPHTVALAVKNAHAPQADREAFLEQIIVRRELAINFVKYNLHYDSLKGCEPWARATLAEHARDEREYVYNERQFCNAETHDPLWNVAQQQMVNFGWMAGYLRMYWAKKILEWTRSPEDAFEIAVRLNDRFELDGRDPNGYAGIAWSIGGKHDRPWAPQRPVFGMIRYMSYSGAQRKFDVQAYIQKVRKSLAIPGAEKGLFDG
jgi:deoxyribodipyrimidine photo-lyase